MCVGPKMELGSVHPSTEAIWPQQVHLKLILSILTDLPLCSCRKQAKSQSDISRQHCGLL